jgi:hypothetical protein
LKEKQQSKSPHATSDLDRSAWQWPKSSSERRESSDTSQATLINTSQQDITRNVQKDKKSSTHSGKTSRNAKTSQTFEADDFRAISASLAERQNDDYSSDDSRYFGTMDDIS